MKTSCKKAASVTQSRWSATGKFQAICRLDRSRCSVLAAGGVASETVCGSATKVPGDHEACAAIAAGKLTEHLRPLNAHRFVADAFRMLKVRGRLLTTTPYPGDITIRLGIYGSYLAMGDRF